MKNGAFKASFLKRSQSPLDDLPSVSERDQTFIHFQANFNPVRWPSGIGHVAGPSNGLSIKVIDSFFLFFSVFPSLLIS